MGGRKIRIRSGEKGDGGAETAKNLPLAPTMSLISISQPDRIDPITNL